MNKIPCISQNMEAKFLPSDVCIFGRLLPATVHSADYWFDSGGCGGSMFHPLSHIDAKTPFRYIETHCCFWSTVSKRGTHFEHSFLIDKSSCKMWIHYLLISSTPLLSHATSIYDQPKWVFWCFQGQVSILGEFSIICFCMTAFKVSIPPLNCCFRCSRVWITLIKPMIYLNCIFSPSESNVLSTQEIQIFPLFCNSSFT